MGHFDSRFTQFEIESLADRLDSVLVFASEEVSRKRSALIVTDYADMAGDLANRLKKEGHEIAVLEHGLLVNNRAQVMITGTKRAYSGWLLRGFSCKTVILVDVNVAAWKSDNFRSVILPVMNNTRVKVAVFGFRSRRRLNKII